MPDDDFLIWQERFLDYLNEISNYNNDYDDDDEEDENLTYDGFVRRHNLFRHVHDYGYGYKDWKKYHLKKIFNRWESYKTEHGKTIKTISCVISVYLKSFN